MSEAWEQALDAIARHLDVVEQAVEDAHWSSLPEPTPLPSLDVPPSPEQRERATRLLAELRRLETEVVELRDTVRTELDAGPARRRAASAYGTSSGSLRA